VAIDFLKQHHERRFAFNAKLIDHAKNVLAFIHRRTASTSEKDYPCKCGGWCEKNLPGENG
jgi:hypothetical protein